jgi:hypothetical protein
LFFRRGMAFLFFRHGMAFSSVTHGYQIILEKFHGFNLSVIISKEYNACSSDPQAKIEAKIEDLSLIQVGISVSKKTTEKL